MTTSPEQRGDAGRFVVGETYPGYSYTPAAGGDPALRVQAYLRKVSREFHRRLRVYGILAEGGHDC